MALRSSISGLRSKAASVETPQDDVEQEEEQIEQAEQVEQIEREAPVTRGRIARPAVEDAPVVVATRGRPRMSDEEKQAAAAVKAAKPAPKPRSAKAPDAGTGLSSKDLRAALKEVEGEVFIVRESVAAAVLKFQPKIDALHSKHAELSAQLAHSLFR